MAVNLVGGKIVNTISFKEDVASRKKAFASLETYKKKVNGLKTQMQGLGNIRIKLDGLATATAQINKLKTQAATVVSPKVVRQPTSGVGTARAPKYGPTVTSAAKLEQAEARRLLKIYKFEMSPAMQKLNELDREAIILKLKKQRSENALTRELTTQQARLRANALKQREILGIQNKQNFAQKRLNGSMLQMAGGALSVFTAMRGIGAVASTGMEMQKVSATMLSVSKDSAEAGENMTFLRKEAHRLGMDRVKAGRAYSKILAARGDLSLEESRNLFTSVSEAGVVSGTSADEMSLQVKALSQMLGKTSVMSEELMYA